MSYFGPSYHVLQRIDCTALNPLSNLLRPAYLFDTLPFEHYSTARGVPKLTLIPNSIQLRLHATLNHLGIQLKKNSVRTSADHDCRALDANMLVAKGQPPVFLFHEFKPSACCESEPGPPVMTESPPMPHCPRLPSITRQVATSPMSPGVTSPHQCRLVSPGSPPSPLCQTTSS